MQPKDLVKNPIYRVLHNASQVEATLSREDNGKIFIAVSLNFNCHRTCAQGMLLLQLASLGTQILMLSVSSARMWSS